MKFKDAELIGIPYIVVVGKSLQEGEIEFRVRKSGEKSQIAVAGAASSIVAAING